MVSDREPTVVYYNLRIESRKFDAYREYHINIEKLEDEYYIIENRHISHSFGSDIIMPYYYLSDQFIEVKNYLSNFLSL